MQQARDINSFAMELSSSRTPRPVDQTNQGDGQYPSDGPQ
jgi:hypothetical protein